MMLFRTAKAAIVSLLGAAAAGRYRVAGYQDQNVSAVEVAGDNRLAQVFYSEGSFPQSASGRGPFRHNVTVNIELIVSEAAGGNLTALNDPLSTPGDIASALAAFEPAASRADDALDEFFDDVFQVLMAGDNLNLGVSSGLNNRWVNDFKKMDVLPRGEYAVLSGVLTLTFIVEEEVVSTDTEDLEFVDASLVFEDDETPKAGTIKVF